MSPSDAPIRCGWSLLPDCPMLVPLFLSSFSHNAQFLRKPLSSRISSAKDLTGGTGSQPVTWSLFGKKYQSFMTSAFATQGEQVEVLHATNDDHGGVVVEVKDQMDPTNYVSLLRASLEIWRQQGKRGVWIKLPIELASLVQSTVEEGFRYHHAEPNYLMLVYWIPATQNTLPVNATHRVGVGAFVMNDKREVLAVQEKSGKFRGSGVWKFPTGVVDPGEDISAGAVREVKEETGIDTEFVEVLAFRQSHKSFFDKSDLFFICMLHPISSDIKKQDSELEAAEWIPIEQFAAQPFVEKHELLRYVFELGLAKFEKRLRRFFTHLYKVSIHQQAKLPLFKYEGPEPTMMTTLYSVYDD